MKVGKKIFFWLLLIIGISACIDEINLNIDTERQFIIVNGLVSNVPDNYSIKLNFSPIIGVGNDNILTPISGASVIFKGNDGTSVQFIESTEKEGVYSAFTAAIPGVTYHLEIRTPDGQNIQSNPSIAPQPVLAIDSLDYEISVIENFNAAGNLVTTEFVDLFLSLNLNSPIRPFLRWRVNGEYKFVENFPMALNPKICYVKENIDFNNISILRSEDVGTNRVSDFQLLSTLMNDRFNQTYCFHVFQYGISEEEYDYWERVDELINIDGTLFDPPPGSIVGNLRNVDEENTRIQGYFSVVSQESKRLFVNVIDKGSFAESKCSSRFNANNPQKCTNCLTINGSTYTKPPYWVP